ncbi:MAG TPA: Tm-1-like ATP-binding domain-containing protein [Pirellulales bacterium]|jgi:uncharacterized protein (UPF0261 family)|nr:Tm-1-like ATP-binding domain-containing protein [Pirellulales bacterium]
MPATIAAVALIATLDTKGVEAGFVRERLQAANLAVRLYDVGCLGAPAIQPDVTSDQVFRSAGSSLAEQRRRAERGEAISAAARGITQWIQADYAAGKIAGVLALGGSAGTTIGTAAMRGLPIGVPKLMVSTLASGQTRPWVGDKDILVLNSIVDLAGINRISRPILTNAAAAMAGMIAGGASPPLPRSPGMAQFAANAAGGRPIIAATMFGVTTPGVQQARQILEAHGYEVLVFHATGNGGQAMESLIDEGLFAGVLDLTTTELADEQLGGILSAGPDRLTAAGRRGIPQVVSVGALDMVNFGPRATVPERFRDRQFNQHNAAVTLMRTTPAENRHLGEEMGRKVAAASGRAAVLFPSRGVSALDRAGQPFDDPTARAELLAGIRATLGTGELIEVDSHINDRSFAEAAADKLLELLRRAAAERTETR